MNTAPEYGTAVCYNAETYRTVGFSFEFGGLVDGEQTKDDLMVQILEFFGIEGVWTAIEDEHDRPDINAAAFPNPFNNEITIRFESQGDEHILVDVIDISGRFIKRLFDSQVSTGIHEVRWDGTSTSGDRVSEGMYFYRVNSESRVASGKMLLLH
jgi:hypothetical protein